MTNRGSFTNKMGFVLATAGAAVGLGNIWRFPYLVAENGGGLFLLIYLLLVFTIGIILIITESAVGRRAGAGVLLAFTKVSKRWTFLGYLSFFIPLLIFSFYAVVGGWVLHYGLQFLLGNGEVLAEAGYFSLYAAEPLLPAFWSVVFLLLTAGIVIRGVQKGVEKTCRFVMPALLVMLVVLAGYCISMPGGLDGVAYFFYPDISEFSSELLIAALGQVFFSLTIGAGLIITYGSYLPRKENLVSSARAVAVFDVAVALLAGLLVIPAVFAFSGGSPETLGSGPDLMFIVLPQVFSSFPFGDVVGAAFFILVFLAAITSSVAIYEVGISSIIDRFSLSRKRAVLTLSIPLAAAVVLVSLGFGLLDFVQINGLNIFGMLDYLTNNILLPISAFLMSFVAGWVIKPQGILDEVCAEGVTFRGQKLFSFALRFVVPAVILIIFISGLL